MISKNSSGKTLFDRLVAGSLTLVLVVLGLVSLLRTTYSESSSPCISVSISANADDGIMANDNAIYPSETYTMAGAYSGNNRSAYFRFGNIAVPKGSTILTAHIHFVGENTISGTPVLTNIYLVDEDNHATPTTYAEWSTDHGIHTTAFAPWDFTSRGSGVAIETADFSTAVTEVLARTGWVFGNALGIHIDNDGSTGSNYEGWAALESTTYTEPSLHICYTPPDGLVQLPVIANGDDGFSVAGSYMDATSSYADVGRSGTPIYNSWFRFDHVTIPQGADILSAHLDLISAGNSGSHPIYSKISCVDEDNHVAPTSLSDWDTDHGIHTGEYSTWNFTAVAVGNTLQSADFSSAVEEVIARTGWVSGNALGVHVDDNGTITGYWQAFATYENTYLDPTLHITYEEAGRKRTIIISSDTSKPPLPGFC
ncbi:MAG: hypothetical protein PHV43_01450 [Candidatus Colwellbacteria bacterium]|nr:hypothetical protein [Candidatus Colwellbacteria bacterium]